MFSSAIAQREALGVNHSQKSPVPCRAWSCPASSSPPAANAQRRQQQKNRIIRKYSSCFFIFFFTLGATPKGAGTCWRWDRAQWTPMIGSGGDKMSSWSSNQGRRFLVSIRISEGPQIDVVRSLFLSVSLKDLRSML